MLNTPIIKPYMNIFVENKVDTMIPLTKFEAKWSTFECHNVFTWKMTPSTHFQGV
jgi:hypothetical protein